jgi:hypothetical protein
VAADRPDVHEVGAPALVGRDDQVGGERAAGAQQAADVEVEHAVPLGDVGCLERRGEHRAGVGDDEVDTADLRPDRVGGAGDRVGV